MSEHKYTKEELKITAILYANRQKAVDYLKKNGRLPKKIETGGNYIGMNVILRTRGRNPELNENEQLVYEAIFREKRLPGGGVLIIQDKCAEKKPAKTNKT